MWLQEVNHAGSGGNLPEHGCNQMTVEEEEVDRPESKQAVTMATCPVNISVTMFHIYYVFATSRHVASLWENFPSPVKTLSHKPPNVMFWGLFMCFGASEIKTGGLKPSQ